MRKTWSVKNIHWESLPEEFLNGQWNRVSYVSSSSPLVTKNGGIYMYCVSIPRAKNKYLERLFDDKGINSEDFFDGKH